MTQSGIENGRLIWLVDVAPPKPAEFMMFRIGQRRRRAVAEALRLTLRERAKMKRRIAMFFLVMLTQFVTDSSAQSNDDAVRQLSGMWRLVSNPQRLADGTTRQGANGITVMGYAFFDATGRHMCYVTMTPNRPVWKSANAPTPDEAVAALRGTNSYCATLDIHATEGFMDRRYDINQNPNQVGRTTRRWFSFQGPDRLTLRVDDAELNKPVVETLFIWERVKD